MNNTTNSQEAHAIYKQVVDAAEEMQKLLNDALKAAQGEPLSDTLTVGAFVYDKNGHQYIVASERCKGRYFLVKCPVKGWASHQQLGVTEAVYDADGSGEWHLDIWSGFTTPLYSSSAEFARPKILDLLSRAARQFTEYVSEAAHTSKLLEE